MSSLSDSITSLPHRWTAAWSTPERNPVPWVSLFTPNAIYTDQAFQIIRQGHPVLTRHYNLWRTANPDFVMTVDTARPIFWDDSDSEGKVIRCSFKTLNKGTWVNDLHVHKASGRKFEFVGIVELVIVKESGLIVELGEWYTNNRFDSLETVGEGYNTLKS